MIIAVELKQCSQETADSWNDGKRYWYYMPVNIFGRQVIQEIAWGYVWFEAWQWDGIKAQIEAMGYKLTKRWYHVNRLREVEKQGNSIHTTNYAKYTQQGDDL